MNQISNHPQVKQYLDSVTEKMSFVEAREGVRRELLNHIEEIVETAQSYGQSLESSIADALQRMGDSESLARNLDLIHQPKTDLFLLSLVAALCCGGLLTLSQTGWASLQAVWVLLGVFAAFFFTRLSYKNVQTTLASLYPLAVLGIIAAVFAGVSSEGQPYLDLFGLKIKIIDLASCLMVVSLPILHEKLSSHKLNVHLLGFLILAPTFYFSQIGSIPSALIVLMGGVVCLGTLRESPRAALTIGAMGTGLILTMIGSSVVTSPTPSIIAQEGHTDFILFTSDQNLKIFGLLAVVALSLLFQHMIFSVRQIKTDWLRATGLICSLTFGLQILLGIGANYGFSPMFKTGLNLPFLSYGGSLMVMHLLMIGITVACLRRRSVAYLPSEVRS